MSWATIGAAIGGVLALINFFILQAVAKTIETNADTTEKSRGAGILRWVAWVDLILLPLVGYYVGPLVAA